MSDIISYSLTYFKRTVNIPVKGYIKCSTTNKNRKVFFTSCVQFTILFLDTVLTDKRSVLNGAFKKIVLDLIFITKSAMINRFRLFYSTFLFLIQPQYLSFSNLALKPLYVLDFPITFQRFQNKNHVQTADYPTRKQ